MKIIFWDYRSKLNVFSNKSITRFGLPPSIIIILISRSLAVTICPGSSIARDMSPSNVFT